jgi:hypothetical protein
MTATLAIALSLTFVLPCVVLLGVAFYQRKKLNKQKAENAAKLQEFEQEARRIVENAKQPPGCPDVLTIAKNMQNIPVNEPYQSPARIPRQRVM